MKDPFIQKLIMTLLAIGCGAAGVYLKDNSNFLIGTAGMLLGWAHGPRPGDIKADFQAGP
jgi:hypothetical protein